MSDVTEISDVDKSFLEPYLPPVSARRKGSGEVTRELPRDSSRTDLPFVTLTYASSLDGMISLSPGVRTTLSGSETKSMTHYLRLHHSAIMVGAGTAVADDPGLNSRYPGATLDLQPQPVIVDPRGRFDLRGKKVSQLASLGQGKTPAIVCGRHAPDETDGSLGLESCSYITVQKHDELDIDQTAQQHRWIDILRTLKASGFQSVMIEGGANVINQLLTEPDLVDTVIVTIAPTWLGVGGVAVTPAAKSDQNGQRVNSARLEDTVWRQFGADVVLCGRPMI